MTSIFNLMVGSARNVSGVAQEQLNDVTPDAFSFDAAYNVSDVNVTDSHTITGIDAAITISWSNSGSETLSVTKNGGAATSGSTTWSASDVLAFTITKGAATGSGTVTFTNNTDSGATLDSFTYEIFVTDVTPAAFTFDASYSATDANITDSHTITGINSNITIAWSNTGSETLTVTKNGVAATSGSTTWSNNDVLAFTLAEGASTGSGTVTFTNQTDSNATLDSFTYTLTVSSDVTPNAVDWNNISDLGAGTDDTINQTISGITSDIDLYYTITGQSGPSVEVRYSINNTTFTALSPGATNTITLSNNDTLKWRVSSQGGDDILHSGTINVFNDTDGDASLDSFTYNLMTSGF